MTDEWNSGWPTLFRVSSPPHHCIPFSQPPPLPSFQPLFLPLSFAPPLHPGEASSLPHYSDVIAPPSDVTTHVASTLPRGQRPLSVPAPLPRSLSIIILSIKDREFVGIVERSGWISRLLGKGFKFLRFISGGNKKLFEDRVEKLEKVITNVTRVTFIMLYETINYPRVVPSSLLPDHGGIISLYNVPPSSILFRSYDQ